MRELLQDFADPIAGKLERRRAIDGKPMPPRTTCHCPEMPALDTAAVVSGEPLRCACCGGALVLTCPGERCAGDHATDGFRAVVLSKRPVRPRHCVGCGAPLPARRGRPSTHCVDCNASRANKNAYIRGWRSRKKAKLAAALATRDRAPVADSEPR